MFIETPYIKINPEMFCSSVRDRAYCIVQLPLPLSISVLVKAFLSDRRTSPVTESVGFSVPRRFIWAATQWPDTILLSLLCEVRNGLQTCLGHRHIHFLTVGVWLNRLSILDLKKPKSCNFVCFQIYRIFTYILGKVSEYISLHHCLRIY